MQTSLYYKPRKMCHCKSWMDSHSKVEPRSHAGHSLVHRMPKSIPDGNYNCMKRLSWSRSDHTVHCSSCTHRYLYTVYLGFKTQRISNTTYNYYCEEGMTGFVTTNSYQTIYYRNFQTKTEIQSDECTKVCTVLHAA